MRKTNFNKKNYNEMGSVTIPAIDYLEMKIEITRLGDYIDRLAEIVKCLNVLCRDKVKRSLGKMSEEKRSEND